ncbi:MAG: type II secretion system F family protein [archaeon]|nr:type II secretion system F family protein [archaeon]
MALRLLEKVPILNQSRALKKYASYLHGAEFKVDPLLWILLSLLISSIAGIAIGYFVQTLILPGQGIQLGLLIFFVIVDLMVGYPYLLAARRIEQIEEALPDALRQMADTLRAGGTYEYALREIATAEYGPLKKEMNEVLRKLEEGENFSNALLSISRNVDSRLVQRTMTIIVDSVNAGAGLANVLEQISEDVRAAHRINKERKSRTVMQVIFMVVAGGIVAPMIFGFVSTISGLLISAAAAVVSASEKAEALRAVGVISLAIQAYIFIETFATSVMISVMREGKLGKSIIYFPGLLFIAYLSYLTAQIVSAAIVGGV